MTYSNSLTTSYKCGFIHSATAVHFWRVSDDASKNNENGVVPGALTVTGPYSETKIKKRLKDKNFRLGGQ